MKTVNFTSEQKKRWRIVRRILLIVLATTAFGYLNEHGISPVCAAVAIVCCQGFFRFVYAVACLVVSLALLVVLVSFLIY